MFHFDMSVNAVVFLIAISNCSSLVYRERMLVCCVDLAFCGLLELIQKKIYGIFLGIFYIDHLQIITVLFLLF